MPVYFPPLQTQTIVANGGMTPTRILATEAFTIPANRQALKAMPIVIEAGGSLVIESNAFLIEVS